MKNRTMVFNSNKKQYNLFIKVRFCHKMVQHVYFIINIWFFRDKTKIGPITESEPISLVSFPIFRKSGFTWLVFQFQAENRPTWDPITLIRAQVSHLGIKDSTTRPLLGSNHSLPRAAQPVGPSKLQRGWWPSEFGKLVAVFDARWLEGNIYTTSLSMQTPPRRKWISVCSLIPPPVNYAPKLRWTHLIRPQFYPPFFPTPSCMATL